jgi:ABC-type glycerol-3-phosphate transport system permease component
MSRTRRRQWLTAAAAWAVTFALIAPFLWMVIGSFKTTVDFLAFPPVFVFTPTLDK